MPRLRSARADDYDIFVRDIRALEILNKVKARGEDTMDSLVSGDTPFGLATNFSDYSKKQGKKTLRLFMTINQKRETVWVKDEYVTKNRPLIPVWKLLIPKAYGERGAIPANVLGPSVVAPPDSLCLANLSSRRAILDWTPSPQRAVVPPD